MTIYLLLPPILLSLGIIMLLPLGKQQREKTYLFFAFFVLFLVMACSSESVGTDTAPYARMFYLIGIAPLPGAITDIIVSAPVYCIICRIVYAFVPNAQAITVVSAAIICVCFAIFFYRFSDNPVCSVYCFVTLWFFCSGLNITRQYIAISFILMSYVRADQLRLKSAILWAALAIGVHNTAALAAPFLFLLHYRYTAKKLLTILLLSVGGIIFVQYGFPYLATFFSVLFPRYSIYFGAAIHSVNDVGKGDNIYVTLFYVIFLILATIVIFRSANRGLIEINSLTKLYAIVCLGVILGVAMSSNLAMDRVRTYFLVSMCCLIPNTLNRLKNRYLFYMGCYAILLIPYIICLSRNISGVVPYQTVWS